MRKSVLALTFLVALPAWAGDRLVVRCANYLISHAQHHSVPSISENYTEKALNSLRRFRAERLGNFDFSPKQTAIDGSSGSSGGTLQRVVARLSGVLEDRRASVTVEGDDATRVRIYASVFEGEAVLGELEARRELRDRLYFEGRDAHAREKVLNLFCHPLIGVAVSGSFWAGLSGMWIAFPLVIPFRYFPEMMVRGFTAYTLAQNMDNKLSRFVHRLAPGDWVYQSEDRRLPLEVSRRVFATKTLSNQEWYNEFDWRAYPKTTLALTGTRLLDPKFNQSMTREPLGWIRRDELLSVSADGVPRLISVLRISERVPPYARKLPAKPVAPGLLNPIPKTN